MARRPDQPAEGSFQEAGQLPSDTWQLPLDTCLDTRLIRGSEAD